jgi:hypothetical protein
MTLPADIEIPAGTLLHVLNANGCAVSPQAVSSFQSAFNHHYSPAITVDGKYGAQTQGALDQVIADATPEDPNVYGIGTAPAACVYHPTPAAPPRTSAPATSTPTVAVASAAGGGSIFQSPWIWAVLALIAGALVLSRSKHPPKFIRKMGLH